MKLRVVALLAGQIAGLVGRKGVRTRPRRGGICTEVACDLVTKRGRSFGRPVHPLEGLATSPEFRARLEMARPATRSSVVCVVLQPELPARGIEPEQRLIAPIHSTEDRIIFEFHHAEVLFLSSGGEAELRVVAVDRRSGEVGTITRFRFHMRYAGLLARCEGHLRGAEELFPLAARGRYRRRKLPAGVANLGFGESAPDEDRRFPASEGAAPGAWPGPTPARASHEGAEG